MLHVTKNPGGWLAPTRDLLRSTRLDHRRTSTSISALGLSWSGAYKHKFAGLFLFYFILVPVLPFHDLFMSHMSSTPATFPTRKVSGYGSDSDVEVVEGKFDNQSSLTIWLTLQEKILNRKERIGDNENGLRKGDGETLCPPLRSLNLSSLLYLQDRLLQVNHRYPYPVALPALLVSSPLNLGSQVRFVWSTFGDHLS